MGAPGVACWHPCFQMHYHLQPASCLPGMMRVAPIAHTALPYCLYCRWAELYEPYIRPVMADVELFERWGEAGVSSVGPPLLHTGHGHGHGSWPRTCALAFLEHPCTSRLTNPSPLPSFVDRRQLQLEPGMAGGPWRRRWQGECPTSPPPPACLSSCTRRARLTLPCSAPLPDWHPSFS